MRIKRLFSLIVVCSMLFCTPVMAAENNDGVTEFDDGTIGSVMEFDFSDINMMSPIEVSDDVLLDQLNNINAVQMFSVDDVNDNNDTWMTATPYNSVETITTQVTNNNCLYSLGMKHANLSSADDEDWYSLNIQVTGEEEKDLYFVDLRNIGRRDWYIELYYQDNGAWYYYTSDPSVYPMYQGAAEKYFYFTVDCSATYYARVTSGNDWVQSMDYFFYVGRAVTEFDINDMPTYGGVNLFGGTYQTYTCDLRNAFPAVTSIEELQITNSFSSGQCSEIDIRLAAGGHNYYNTSGSSNIRNIRGVSLNQIWTIGAKCSQNMHSGTHWSGRLNGSFECIMAPYPGNEL